MLWFLISDFDDDDDPLLLLASDFEDPPRFFFFFFLSLVVFFLVLFPSLFFFSFLPLDDVCSTTQGVIDADPLALELFSLGVFDFGSGRSVGSS